MSRARRVPGRGAAMARQMGLLADPGTGGSPGGVAGDGGDAALEAELLLLLGGREAPEGGAAPQPPPRDLAAVEALAQLCLRDPPEEEEEEEGQEDLENEEELLAELQEVLQDGSGSEADAETPQDAAPAGALLAELQERAELYRAALGNAPGGTGRDGARLRRLQRGLKTLEQLLASALRGDPIDRSSIPPPVALGKPPPASPEPPAPNPPNPPLDPPDPPLDPPKSPLDPPKSPLDPPNPPLDPPKSPHFPPNPPLDPPNPPLHPPNPPLDPPKSPLDPPNPPLDPPKSPLDPPNPPRDPPNPPLDPHSGPALRRRLQELQQEALLAKRRGDNATALSHFRAAKKLEAQLEAMGRDPQEEPKDPPARDPPTRDPPTRDPPTRDPPTRDPPTRDPPASSPEPPRDVQQALQQNMQRYRAAAGQARASGDGRKARMHERILKQYQAALAALSSGRAVDLSELPVPPGCPPIPGTGGPAEPGIAGVLEAALKLAQEEEEEEEEEEKEEAKVQPSVPAAPPPKQPPRNSQPAPRAAGKAQQQLEFLELRRRQLAQAALRAKRRQDLQGAKALLRRARGVQGLLGAARAGLPVDLAQVPEVPLDGAEFELGPARGVPVPPEAEESFLQLAGALRRQHQLCLSFSRQFAQLGNIAETTRCEALAEECRGAMELLRRERGRGAPPPRARVEQRSFSVVRMFPELSSSDLELGIERGRGLPAPPGVAPGDLDTFVRFEFPHPSADEPQRDKTPVVKSTDCPEFRARFRLRLLRGARGLRRLLSRGVRLEVLHKGGLFRPERALGSALLRLEGLERSCELRQQLELLDGRRRTGAVLEVWVRVREPLGPHRELEPRSERWLVLEPAPEAAVPRPPAPAAAPQDAAPRSLPSLSLLLLDRERLERKMGPAGRPVPPELQRQHRELLGSIRGLRARLQGGDPRFRAEYTQQLQLHLRLYTEAARRLGTQGDREAAKEALHKRNLVESELQKLRG